MKTINSRDNISIFQLITIISALIITVGFLDIHSIVKKIAIDAWIPLLLTILLSPLLLLAILKLAELFPNDNIISYSKKLVGKPLGNIIGFYLSTFYLFAASICTALVISIIKIFLLEITPKEFIILIQIILIFYTIWFGIQGIARLAERILPGIIIIIIIFLIAATTKSDFSNILPIGKSGVLAILKEVPIVFCHFIGLSSILILYPFLNIKKNLYKPLVYTTLFNGFLVLLLIFIGIAIFRYEITDIYFMNFSLFQRIDLGVSFLERLGYFFLIIIIPVFVIFEMINYYMAVIGFSTLFNLKDHQAFSILLLPIVFLIANLPISIADLFLLRYYAEIATIIILLIPIILLIIAKLKYRGENNK